MVIRNTIPLLILFFILGPEPIPLNLIMRTSASECRIFQKIWNYCTVQEIPLVYASSAATYGAGELGYNDDHDLCHKLKPLNPYGVSKNEFDKWVLHQERSSAILGRT